MATGYQNGGPVQDAVDRPLDTDPIRNFKFLVNIVHGNIGFNLGFTEVSGLSANTATIPYREGGYNTTMRQVPGQTEFSPITLSHGVILGGNADLAYKWFSEIFKVDLPGAPGNGVGRAAGEGNENSFRAAKVRILVLEHPVTRSVDSRAVVRFQLHNAWPSSISYSNLNSADNAFLVEQMTLSHEGFTVGIDTGIGVSAQK